MTLRKSRTTPGRKNLLESLLSLDGVAEVSDPDVYQQLFNQIMVEVRRMQAAR